MELDKAISIIRALSDGVDPYTGEQYSSDSPYQKPDTIRALFAAIEALEKQKKAKIRKKEQPGSAGKPWNEEEDNRMLQAYDAGTPIIEISEAHGRTVGAIESRLVRHGRINRG